MSLKVEVSYEVVDVIKKSKSAVFSLLDVGDTIRVLHDRGPFVTCICYDINGNEKWVKLVTKKKLKVELSYLSLLKRYSKSEYLGDCLDIEYKVFLRRLDSNSSLFKSLNVNDSFSICYNVFGHMPQFRVYVKYYNATHNSYDYGGYSDYSLSQLEKELDSFCLSKVYEEVR